MKELNAWSKSFLHTSSMSKHWRICVLSGVVVFCGLELAANVIDDSLFWWRGPHDANGDGCISAEEILNARFPKNDSSHQGVTLYGNANVQENDNVHSPWNGVLSSTMSMRFVADTAYASSLNIPVSKTSLAGDTSSFTLHLRCKWTREAGLTVQAIGKLIQRSHATVIYYLRTYEDDYNYTPEFRSIANKVKDYLKKLNTPNSVL